MTITKEFAQDYVEKMRALLKADENHVLIKKAYQDRMNLAIASIANRIQRGDFAPSKSTKS